MVKVKAFTKQAQECDKCGEKIKVDTILNMETSESYYICPKCGKANIKT